MTQEVKSTPVVETTGVAEPTVKAPSTMGTPDYMAIAAFILGLINICAWLVPICGCSLSAVALGLGIAGLKSEKYKWMGIVGIVLGALGLLASIGNWALGTYYYMENPEMNPLNNL